MNPGADQGGFFGGIPAGKGGPGGLVLLGPAAVPAAPEVDRRVHDTAVALVRAMRAGGRQAGGVKALLAEYDLASGEGIILMCLAEALLRIPDAGTADA